MLIGWTCACPYSVENVWGFSLSTCGKKPELARTGSSKYPAQASGICVAVDLCLVTLSAKTIFPGWV